MPNPASQPLRVAVLISEGAGTVARLGKSALRAELLSLFESAGIRATLDFLPGAQLRNAAERALQSVREGKLDAVMAGGGDGSIRSVAGVLAGTDVPLGILALGTLNHFARDLKIPLSPSEAVAVVAAGAVRRIDVGTMNGGVFLNNSSIGFYPILVLERERLRRHHHLPKWLAMLVAEARLLRHLPLFRLSVRVGGSVEACRSPLIFIGNNAYRLTLSELGTRERLDGGELSIYVAKSQGFLALLRLACRTIFGLSPPAGDMRILAGTTADIASRRHHLLVAFDGEVERVRPPLHYAIAPGALRVFVPPGSAA